MAINNNSLEQLLEAIDIIASQRASENNAYDQTIICTIVDNSKAEQYGYYTVTNDTLTFQAYSDNLTYKVGNYVRVSIPNGDYSQQKYITGLYQYNTGEAVSYVSPLDTFMGISTLIDDRATPTSDKLVNQPIGMIANGNDNNGNDIPPVIIGSADTSMQASGMYDTIGLQADFKCALGSQYNIRSGSYGLQLDLTIKLDGTNQTVIHSIYMDSANFFGDPYNFKVYSTQAQTYDISNLGGTIVSFVAKPYQRDDFTYEANGTIERVPASEQEANIFVANIYVALGNDLYKVENHTVKLYTNNSLSYKHSSENGDLEALNTKTLSVLYYNKDENNEYIGFNDGRWTDENNRYSELEYLREAEDDRRLRGQRGTDIPDTFGTLDMLDRYYKILPVIDEAIGYVETTVVRTLQSLKRELTGCGAVNAIVDGWVAALGSNIGTAKDARKALVDGIFDEKNKVDKNWSVQQIDIDFFDFTSNSDANYWPIFDGDVFAPEIKRVVTEDYPQYRSIYEDYAKQMLEIKARVEEACNRIAIETGKMYDCKATQGVAFIEKDFSVYDNYYDIFWYRENPTWVEPDRFMPTGWEPIIQNDIGLPTEQDKDKPGYLVKYCPNDRNNITVILNGDTKKERFRVVIVHNHNCYYSNILEFTNVDEFAEEEIMTSEAIELKHGEHSRESYQMLYSSGYQLINRADARLDRAIELTCKEEFGGNESLCGATVYWYIPANLTMLTYDEELLTTSRELQYDDEQKLKVTIEPLIKLAENETEGPYQYFRPGYHCFYKQVSKKPDGNADPEALNEWAAALTEDLKFYYNIKENLVPCNVHNDIECVVVLDDENKTTLEASIRVVFGALGTNGTNYSLVVMPATKQYCVTTKDPMPIDIALYDYDGNWVEDATFQTSWNGPTNYTHKDNQVSMTNPDKENPNNDTGVGILTVKTTIGIESPKEGGRDRIVDLFVQYPISWGRDKGYYIAGATTITYNSNGSNPEYYKGPYVLYDKNHQEQTGIEWDIELYDASQGLIDSSSDPSKGYEFYKNYMPMLSKNNTIIPAPMYVSGCECYPVVVARQNGNEVWRQPIVITQNRYPSQYLNQWDGSLEIDEKNGTIMSNLVGAGKKEEDNSFSGVLMGEVAMKAKIDPEKDPVQNRNHSGLGLYGFHYGAQSFGFNVDGTAFIGKSGGGRISFDGNQGFIYSDNWLQSFEEGSRNKAFIHNSDGYYELGEGKDGMAIDLHSGHIDANNFRLRSENIKMNSGNRLDQNKYIINFETSKQMRPITELINIENISVPYYELIDGVYASRSKEEAAEILNNNGTLYTTLHCNEYDYNKNKYDFPGFSENKQYYIKNADGVYVKYTADPLEFKEGSVLYDFIDKGHGCYYIRFDKDGNLDLSISDGTFLADSGLTLKEYFDKIRNDTTIHIEDEVIGIPPELEADTVFDFITGEVDRIENDVIGLPPSDLEKGTVYSYINAQEYLTTEGVFNGLTDNGNKLGVFSVDKNEDGNIEELYINASYIITGILRSANWKGMLYYHRGEEKYGPYSIKQAEEMVANGEVSWDDKWSIVADEGTYWNLNNGQLFAKRFELNALDGEGNGLYLSNNPDSNKLWLFVGNDDNFIEMTDENSLSIKTSQLSIDAWDKREYNNKIYDCGIILDSSIDNQQQPWLLVGSQQTNDNGNIVDGNFIQFTKNNDLTIQIGSGTFVLNAWNGVEDYEEGIYISSKGYNTDNGKVYFRAGTVRQSEINDSSNLIEVSDERVLLKTTELVLDAYDKTKGGIYLNSDPKVHSNGNEATKDSYLYMGNDTHFIQYTGGSNLKINVNDFALDAFDNKNKKGIYFNSNPNPAENAKPIENQQGYYFVIGKNDSFISLDSKGKFIIQTNDDFTLNAWNESASSGVVISNNPTNSQPYYLAVGDGDDYIRVKNNEMSLSSHIFTLNAWNNSQGIYLNSRPNNDYYLKIGNMSGSAPLEFIDVKQYSMFASDGSNVSVTVSPGTWYNYKYKILTDDKYSVTVNEKFEYFIFDENNLPDGSAANLSCVEHDSYATGGSFTIENYRDKYLIINKPAEDEPFTISENKDNSYITYHSNGTLKICVSDLAIGGQDFQNAVNKKIDSYNFIAKLQKENLQGIYKDGETGNFYISSSYLQVLSESSGIIFCADGVRKKVEIGGFEVTKNSILSKDAAPGSINSVFISTGLNENINCSLGGSDIQSGWVFGAGKAFGVHSDGSLYSSSGMIGGWTIESKRLVANGDVACGLLSNDDLECPSLHSDGQSYLRIYLGSTSDFKKSYNITQRKIDGSISNNKTITAKFNLEPNETVKQFKLATLKVSVPLMWVVKYKNASNIGNYSFDIPFALQDSNFSIDSVVVDKFSVSEGVSTSWTEVLANQYSWKETTSKVFNGSTYYKTVSFKPNTIGTYRVSIYLKRILNDVIVSNSDAVATMMGTLDDTVLPFNVLNFNLLDSLNRWYANSETSTQPIYYYEPINEVERSPISGTGSGYSQKETYPQFGNYSKATSSAIHPSREATYEGSCVVVYRGKAVEDPTAAPTRFLDDGSIYAKAIKCDTLTVSNTFKPPAISTTGSISAKSISASVSLTVNGDRIEANNATIYSKNMKPTGKLYFNEINSEYIQPSTIPITVIAESGQIVTQNDNTALISGVWNIANSGIQLNTSAENSFSWRKGFTCRNGLYFGMNYMSEKALAIIPAYEGSYNLSSSVSAYNLVNVLYGKWKMSPDSSLWVGNKASIDCSAWSGTGCLNGEWQVMGTMYNSGGSSVITSAQSSKHDIEILDDRYLNLFDNLIPVRFKYNNGTSNRYHTGLILEALKTAMDNSDLLSSELAAYCITNPDDGVGFDGGIRYEELISIIIAKLQQVDKEKIELQQQLQALQQTINNLQQ